MAGGSTDGDHQQPLAEINVTPLVDVLLVLLVIFMLAAPLFAKAVRIDLPRAEAAPSVDSVVATLALYGDARLELDGQVMAREQLVTLLSARLARQPQLVVRIAADAAVPYQLLAELLTMLQHHGIQRIAFATQPAGDAH